MSYCRWSSDNFKCDLYCYADCGGGYTTHVARYRWRLWFRIYCWITDKRIDICGDKFRMPRYHYRDLIFDLPHWLIHKKIKLPEAGEAFNDTTLEKFRDRVGVLISAGFKVPDYVLPTIKSEIREADDE